MCLYMSAVPSLQKYLASAKRAADLDSALKTSQATCAQLESDIADLRQELEATKARAKARADDAEKVRFTVLRVFVPVPELPACRCPEANSCLAASNGLFHPTLVD